MLDYLNRFITALAADPQYSDNTTAAYQNDLTQFADFLKDSQGGMVHHPAQIGPDTLQDFVSHLQERGYASSTVARKLAAVKSFFHYLVRNGDISRAPTAGLATPKFKKPPPHVLSEDQVEQLLTAPGTSSSPKATRDRALLELLYATGMRVTEIVSLLVQDLDLEAGYVRCEGQHKKERVVPIQNERARQVLRDYVIRVRPTLLKQPGQDALFLNHRGQPLTRQGLWLIIKSYAQQAGVTGEVTPHTLRHSFAHHALNQGEDIHRLQRLLGHANLSTTQVYAQLDEKTPDGDYVA